MDKEEIPLIIFRGVKIIDPRSSFHHQLCDVYVEKGKIKEIYPQDASPVEVDHAFVWMQKGAYLSPGWVDMQTHLQDPGFEWRENISQLALAAARGGFVSVLVYPDTEPFLDNGQAILASKRQAANLPIDILFTGTITKGKQGKDLSEIHEMIQAGAMAFTDGLHAQISSGVFLRALQYLSPLESLLLQYPTDHQLTANGLLNEGPISVSLGMKGIPEVAETIGSDRDSKLLSYYPTKVHFQPISSPQAVEILYEAKQRFPGISIGTTSYLIHFQDELLTSFDTNLKTFPPIRSEQQVSQLKEQIKEGKIDVITSGHLAQGIEEKVVPFPIAEFGMLNLATSFPLINESLVKNSYINLDKMVEMLSINPRKILGLRGGEIEKGKEASFTLFNPHQKWKINPSLIPSRSKNSPLLNKELSGQILGIYHNGLFLQQGSNGV